MSGGGTDVVEGVVVVGTERVKLVMYVAVKSLAEAMLDAFELSEFGVDVDALEGGCR